VQEVKLSLLKVEVEVKVKFQHFSNTGDLNFASFASRLAAASLPNVAVAALQGYYYKSPVLEAAGEGGTRSEELSCPVQSCPVLSTLFVIITCLSTPSHKLLKLFLYLFIPPIKPPSSMRDPQALAQVPITPEPCPNDMASLTGLLQD
jgi:hypothetical protein